jgi:corrinoid protein of di/trimethylamine methyltransferase
MGSAISKKERILRGLEHAVITGKKDESVRHAEQVISENIDPIDAIDSGLIKGMMIVGERYSTHKFFLPQVLLAADAMYAALNILLPHITQEAASKRVRVVIGVVEGDVHDIGKNIVKTMLTASGFDVSDLGKDVADDAFVKGAKKQRAQVVAMSTLMTPTMDSMKATVDALVEDGARKEIRIIIGGAPTSPEFAEEIGADMHAVNAQDAVAKLKAVF